MARTLGFEWLEDRWLLSSVPAPAGPRWADLAVAASSIPLFVARGSVLSGGDLISSGSIGEVSAAEPASSTGPGELRIAPPPVTRQVIGPGPSLSSSASLATAGGTIMTAESTGGGFALATDLPVFALAPVPSPGILSTQTTAAALAGVTSSAPPPIAISVLANGEVIMVAVMGPPAGEIVTTWFGGFNSADVTMVGSTTTAAQAGPRALFLTPLLTETLTGFARFAANAPISLAAAAPFGNAVTLVGLGSVILAPSESTRVSAGSPPVMDRSLALARRWMAQLPPSREVPDLGNQGTAATPDADAGCMAAEASHSAVPVTAPQRSDLITNFMPFDQAALGQTIDQFLKQLEDMGDGLSSLQGPTVVVIALLATSAGLTAWKVVPRVLLRARDNDELATVDITTSLTGISGLPGGSSSEEP
jgi:hypothetical protein